MAGKIYPHGVSLLPVENPCSRCSYRSNEKRNSNLTRVKFKLQIVRVCRTDCVKVQNFKKKAKEHHIQLALTNKKLTNGELTSVEKSSSKSNEAYAFYSDYKGKSFSPNLTNKHLTNCSLNASKNLFCNF